MTFPEATDLAVFSKELFPRTTDAQAAVVRDLVVPFPDVEFVRALLKRLATETTILPTPMVRAELQAELRRRGETSEQYARQQERLTEGEAMRQRRVVESLIADMSDEDLEDLKPQALEVLRERLKPEGFEFIQKHLPKMKPRDSVLLKTAIYKVLRGGAAA